SLVLPLDGPQEGEAPGFDLDGVDDQCGVADHNDSVDNELARIGTLLKAQHDMNAELAAAIEAGNIALSLELSGYDGSGDDDSCVLVTIRSNGEVQGETVEGLVQDGTLYASLGAFPLTLPVRDTPVLFDIQSAYGAIDLATLEGQVGGGIDLGSDQPYTAAVGADAEEGTLYRAIYEVLETASNPDPYHAAIPTILGDAPGDLG